MNLIDLAELIAACCRANPSRPTHFAYAPVRLLSRPAQIYTIVLTATLLGLFLGLIFGVISASEVTKADPMSPTPYNPLPATRQYMMYWLPVSAVIGFVGIAVALTCLRPPPPPNMVDEFRKATFETYDARGAYLQAPTHDRAERSQ